MEDFTLHILSFEGSNWPMEIAEWIDEYNTFCNFLPIDIGYNLVMGCTDSSTKKVI